MWLMAVVAAVVTVIILGCSLSIGGGTSRSAVIKQDAWQQNCLVQDGIDPEDGVTIYSRQIGYNNSASGTARWSISEWPSDAVYGLYDTQERFAWLCGSEGEYKITLTSADGKDQVVKVRIP